MIQRRSFVIGLLAMPAIVRAPSLMRLATPRLARLRLWRWNGEDWEEVGVLTSPPPSAT